MRYQESTAAIFDALADPTRREIVEALATQPQRASELALVTGTSRSRMSKHLKVLMDAGIAEDERPREDARVRIFHLRPEAIDPMREWLERLQRNWDARLAAFKRHAEQRKDREQ